MDGIMTIGFTGTRNGLTLAQLHALTIILDEAEDRCCRHGGAIGADSQFNELARRSYKYVIIHPSDVLHQRGDKLFCDECHEPKPPIDRNRDIVDASNYLIACPATMQEEQRSGTWMTVSYTIKLGKPVVIVWPNGVTEWRGWPEVER